MLKMNQKLAVLCSCCLLACVTTSTASHADETYVITKDGNGEMILTVGDADSITRNHDDWQETFSKGEHGEALGYMTSRENCYVVTTAEGLPEDCLYQVSGLAPLIESGSLNLEDYPALDGYTVTEVDPDSITWAEGYEDWFSHYPEGAKLYCIGKNCSTEIKKLFKAYDSVLDALYLWNDYHGTVCWDGHVGIGMHPHYDNKIVGYIAYQDGELIYLDTERKQIPFPYPIPEERKAQLLKHFEKCPNDQIPETNPLREEEENACMNVWSAIDETVGMDWKTRYDEWYNSIEEETRKNMTPAELEASRIRAGVESDYEMIQKAYQLCDEQMKLYGDVLTSITPSITYRFSPNEKMIYENGETVYTRIKRPETIWDTFADVNGDKEITACDASSLLQYCAGISTGAIYQNPNDKERKLDVYDINADGKIDASDASDLLLYVSQLGSGKVESMQEFLKQQGQAEKNS